MGNRDMPRFLKMLPKNLKKYRRKHKIFIYKEGKKIFWGLRGRRVDIVAEGYDAGDGIVFSACKEYYDVLAELGEEYYEKYNYQAIILNGEKRKGRMNRKGKLVL